jgi:hypothetical protein
MWTDQVAGGKAAASQLRLQAADVDELSVALRAAWKRINELQARVRELKAEQAQRPVPAPLPAPFATAAPPSSFDFVSLVCSETKTLKAFTGAPSLQRFEELIVDLQKPPRSPWAHSVVSLRSAVLMALCHLRLHIPMRAFPGLFGCAIGTVTNALHDVMRALEALSVEPNSRGAVRFLHDAEIAATLPQRVRDHMPDLKLIGDCTSVFVERPADLDLVHLLFDGEQYSGTWVKYFLACAPSGYVMHVGSPYAPAGRAADGRILPYELMVCENFRTFANRGGVWLADYGFRGSKVPENVELRLPRRAAAGEQMTAEDNDFNRDITRLRWLIEADNNRLKNFRYFRDVLSWKEVPNVKQYMTVACFLFNRWHQPLLPLNEEDKEM